MNPLLKSFTSFIIQTCSIKTETFQLESPGFIYYFLKIIVLRWKALYL